MRDLSLIVKSPGNLLARYRNFSSTSFRILTNVTLREGRKGSAGHPRARYPPVSIAMCKSYACPRRDNFRFFSRVRERSLKRARRVLTPVATGRSKVTNHDRTP